MQEWFFYFIFVPSKYIVMKKLLIVKTIVFILLLVFIVLVSSCSTCHNNTQKRCRLKRTYTKVTNVAQSDLTPQYIIANNQIIMLR